MELDQVDRLKAITFDLKESIDDLIHEVILLYGIHLGLEKRVKKLESTLNIDNEQQNT